MCVCVAICPCAYDESRAVRGVWAYNRVERGRARMQLQFLDMLLNLLFVLMVSLMLLLLLSSTRR